MKNLYIIGALCVLSCRYSYAQNGDEADQFIAKYKNLSENYKSCQQEVEEQKRLILQLQASLKQEQSTKIKYGNASTSTHVDNQKSTTSYVDINTITYPKESDSITRNVRGSGTYYAIQFGVASETPAITNILGVRLLGYNKAQQNYIYRVDNIESYEKSEELLKSIESENVSSAYITKYINGQATDYYTFNQSIDRSKLLTVPANANTPVSKSSNNTKSEANWEYTTDEYGNPIIKINTKAMSPPSNSKNDYSVKMQPNWEYGTDENGNVKIIVKPN